MSSIDRNSYSTLNIQTSASETDTVAENKAASPAYVFQTLRNHVTSGNASQAASFLASLTTGELNDAVRIAERLFEEPFPLLPYSKPSELGKSDDIDNVKTTIELEKANIYNIDNMGEEYLRNLEDDKSSYIGKHSLFPEREYLYNFFIDDRIEYHLRTNLIAYDPSIVMQIIGDKLLEKIGRFKQELWNPTLVK